MQLAAQYLGSEMAFRKQPDTRQTVLVDSGQHHNGQ